MDYQDLSAAAPNIYYGLHLHGPIATWGIDVQPAQKRLAILERHVYPDKIWLKDLNASGLWQSKKYDVGFCRGFVIYAKEPETLYKSAFDFEGAHQTLWPGMPAPLPGYGIGDIFALAGRPVVDVIPIDRFFGNV